MKLLCLGNSITRHRPKADIGWSGDWGMAASRPENDYAHQLTNRLEQAGTSVTLLAENLAIEVNPDVFPADALADFLAFAPDALVIRLGENVPDATKYDAYLSAYGRVLDAFLAAGTPHIFCVGNFWQRDDLDEKTAALAKEKGVSWVSLSAVQGEAFRAIGEFAHAGVAAHPSDKGMAAIADCIFTAMRAAGTAAG